MKKIIAMRVTVGIPAYNEEKNIQTFLDTTIPILEKLGEYEIIFCSTNGENKDLNLPVMEGRKNDEQTKIYICKNYICDLPITNMSELNSQLKGIVGIYK